MTTPADVLPSAGPEPRPADPIDVPRAPKHVASGRRSRPELIVLAVLLIGTAVLYLWNLSASGWANSYYAAAVQAMTQSWKAFFFGSLDTGNIVTVDKPPASLWVMALSGRIFGFSSLSMLAPQALMGVGTVALLYASVRRVAGPVAGLLSGFVMALTPVAVVMFRFNNPDALLVLLLVAAAYATTRAIERAGTRWLVLAGVLIGFAFLAKMGQAFVVVPALGLAYLIAAPTGLWRRIRQLLLAGVAIVVSGGWWVAIVDLWPAADRPYIGGSETNSVLELALGYNGLGRIFGGEGRGRGMETFTPPAGATFTPPAGATFTPPAGGGGGGFGGQAGLTRMFNSEVGTQASWLLPAALLLLVAALWLLRRAPRTDRMQAALILWGAWTVVTMLVFSFAEGIFHAYYTVALAPGIAAVVGIGGRELWRHRASWPGRATLAVLIAVTSTWAFVLLERTPTFLPWLRWTVLAIGVLALVAVLVPTHGRRVAAVVAAVLLVGIAAPAAYAADTAGTPKTGSMPSAGPATAGDRFGGGSGGGGAGGDRGDGRGGQRLVGTPPGAAAPGSAPTGAQTGAPTGTVVGRGPGGEGVSDPALVALLKSAGTAWSAATIGAQSGASLQLASNTSVMAIGGFSGSDPAPTLAQFQAYVADGQVHYFVAEGGGGFNRGGSSSITTWVQEHFTATTVGGATVYDLTQPKS